MRAKRWALTTALSAVLLTAPASRPVELPFVGAENAYAEETRCTIEICFEVDLKLFSARACFTKTFDCR
jgi:hypothetical protein